jgi:hypothetical protein
MTKEQVVAEAAVIKEKLAQVYMKEKGKSHEYGLDRAERIFHDISIEKFGPPEPRTKAVPKVKSEKAKKVGKTEAMAAETAGE